MHLVPCQCLKKETKREVSGNIIISGNIIGCVNDSTEVFRHGDVFHIHRDNTFDIRKSKQTGI